MLHGVHGRLRGVVEEAVPEQLMCGLPHPPRLGEDLVPGGGEAFRATPFPEAVGALAAHSDVVRRRRHTPGVAQTAEKIRLPRRRPPVFAEADRHGLEGGNAAAGRRVLLHPQA